jgi:hypothetical protein
VRVRGRVHRSLSLGSGLGRPLHGAVPPRDRSHTSQTFIRHEAVRSDCRAERNLLPLSPSNVSPIPLTASIKGEREPNLISMRRELRTPSGPPTNRALQLEHSPDYVEQVRQHGLRMTCGDDIRIAQVENVRSSRGKPVARRRAQMMARSSSLAFQGTLWGRAERFWQSAGTALAPFANGLGRYAIAVGQNARRLKGAGDLGADSWCGAGVGVNGEHQCLPEVAGRPRRSKGQAYCSTGKRT